MGSPVAISSFKMSVSFKSSMNLTSLDNKISFEDENCYISFQAEGELNDECEIKTLEKYSKLITRKLN